jgi:hypothetical protein
VRNGELKWTIFNNEKEWNWSFTGTDTITGGLDPKVSMPR